ncbi:MAG: type 1 glutamine amidotransferase [Fibrobacteraceae bacterium]
MRIAIFQHVPFETEGSIADTLRRMQRPFEHIPLFDGASIPASEDIDFAVFMGGPMSVNDEKEYPWLAAEKEFAREYIQKGKPALGICLGAQIMASALGAQIFKNPRGKEIGWHPVSGKIPGFPMSFMAFHWHGETFNLPQGAERIAESAACKNQAFRYKNAIGLQFHLETTEESMQSLIRNCEAELGEKDPYIQSKRVILEHAPKYIPQGNALMDRLLISLLPARHCI